MTFFEGLKNYVGFSPESSTLLAGLHPLAKPHFQAIVDDFYRAILAHETANAAITGGEAQINRLKTTLLHWLDQLLSGPHDEAYFEQRARIGRMHVKVNLPQQFMFTAMNRIRTQLLSITQTQFSEDTDRCLRTGTAVDQILDLELAIMLETYREDLMARNLASERLATLGQFAVGIGHEL